MADIKLDGLTVASSSGSPTVVNLDSDVASRIAAKGIAKAWVKFNGAFDASSLSNNFTLANGGINAAFNITSVDDVGTGVYDINLTSSMKDENGDDTTDYVALMSGSYHTVTMESVRNFQTGQFTANKCRVRFGYSHTSPGSFDPPEAFVIIFGS